MCKFLLALGTRSERIWTCVEKEGEDEDKDEDEDEGTAAIRLKSGYYATIAATHDVVIRATKCILNSNVFGVLFHTAAQLLSH